MFKSFKVIGKGEGRFYIATGYVPAAQEPDALYYAKSPSKNIVIIYLHIFFNLSDVISFLPFHTTSIFVHSAFKLSVTRKFRILKLVWFRKYISHFSALSSIPILIRYYCVLFALPFIILRIRCHIVGIHLKFSPTPNNSYFEARGETLKTISVSFGLVINDEF